MTKFYVAIIAVLWVLLALITIKAQSLSSKLNIIQTNLTICETSRDKLKQSISANNSLGDKQNEAQTKYNSMKLKEKYDAKDVNLNKLHSLDVLLEQTSNILDTAKSTTAVSD